MSERQLISSGGPWEASAGYSRAIAVGDSCWVAGTTDAGPGGKSRNPANAAAQTRAILGIIESALTGAGFSLSDIVRTRIYVTDIADSGDVLAVHGAVFGSIRPAATLVEVSGLMDPSLLVEIEAEARRS